jgi:hypothetical protein
MPKDVLVSFVSTIGRPTDRAVSRILTVAQTWLLRFAGWHASIALARGLRHAAEKQEEGQRDWVKLWHRTTPPAANYLGRL